MNLEAGVVVANHRNESGNNVTIRLDGSFIDTGVRKFGALIGDRVRVGANSVLAPGTLLPPGTIIERLSLVDQER